MSIQATIVTTATPIVRKNRMGNIVRKGCMKSIRLNENGDPYELFTKLAPGVVGVVGEDYIGIEVNGVIVSLTKEMTSLAEQGRNLLRICLAC